MKKFADWIQKAPGLDISSYRLARTARGELVGFLAVWDQRSFKQLTVVGYSRRMNAAGCEMKHSSRSSAESKALAP